MFLSELLLKRSIWAAGSQCRWYRTANPGVGRRLKIFKQENPDLSKTKITESDVEDLEVNIMNAGLLKSDYEKEHDKISKKMEFQRVERKYFDKMKSPNFLLWSEKEQIRQLHESQPYKWTFEQLSESFPATHDVIKKIVRAQWKMKDPDSVKRHDSRVMANWKLFQELKLNLPPHISSHLSKFTARDHSFQTKECTDIFLADVGPKVNASLTGNSEFADIITNYGGKVALPPDGTREADGSKFMPSTPGETYVLNDGQESTSKRGEHFTLTEMRKSGKISPTQSPLPHRPSPEDVSSSVEGPTMADRKTGVINPSDFFSVPQRSYADSSNIEQTDDLPEKIPMKIFIPKNKWKKGAVYRVNNCFYADDGEFLYKI